MAESKTRILRMAGHDYRIRGAESDEQLRQIETYLNDTIDRLRKPRFWQEVDFETVLMLTAINVADDYIKADQERRQLRARMDKLEKEADRYEEEILRLESENQDYAERLKKTRKGSEKQ